MSDLDIVKRENVIEKLAQKRTDDVDTQTLMEMFQENQSSIKKKLIQWYYLNFSK